MISRFSHVLFIFILFPVHPVHFSGKSACRNCHKCRKLILNGIGQCIGHFDHQFIFPIFQSRTQIIAIRRTYPTRSIRKTQGNASCCFSSSTTSASSVITVFLGTANSFLICRRSEMITFAMEE